MPSSSSLLPRGLSFSQIQKCIPRKWKQGIQQPEAQSKQSTTSFNFYKPIDSLFTSLESFVSQGQLVKAFKTFSLIQCHTSCLDSNDFVVLSLSHLLLSCANLKYLPQGKQLHAHIISSGFTGHPILVPKLITFYANFNFLVEAHYITETSNIFDPFPWNLVISSYVRVGLCREALSSYKQMVRKGVRPDNFTYSSVLKSCGEEFDLCFGREVHKSIECSGVDRDLYVQNALISMYGKFGEVEVARKLFDKMPERDVVSWNSMISGYASKGMWGEALELFETMSGESIKLNIITWNTIAGGFLRSGKYKGALELLSRMRKFGFYLDSVAVIIGLGACSQIGLLNLGKEIHCLAIRMYCFGFAVVKNSLITMYSKCKDFRHANTMFYLVESKNVITWNSIISGYTHWDQSENAFFLFREMINNGVEPNYVTIAAILPLCARVANLQHGREVHCYIIRREGFNDCFLLWNALVDMYARSGKIPLAKRLFYLLIKKDRVTYSSLISAYGKQGEGKAALELFDEMIKCQIKPDHVTMLTVLSACSHSGRVAQGQMLFENMLNIYGITPRLEHFACMVDLFGRAGLLKKAVEIFKRMPYQPTPAMWVTVIRACRIHGNTYIGEWAAEKLLEMKPQTSGME